MFEPTGADVTLYLIILVGGAVTLINRMAGHYVLRRFEPIPYRVEAALEAVPVAVITAIILPAAIDGGWMERLVLVVAMLLGVRFSFLVAGGLSLVLLIVLRSVFG
ncbi:MAG: AzlD domain-containing protein [Pseudomonadota bacterium]